MPLVFGWQPDSNDSQHVGSCFGFKQVDNKSSFFFSASIHPTLRRLLQCVLAPSESQQPLRIVKTNTAICFGGGRIERPQGGAVWSGGADEFKWHARKWQTCLFVCRLCWIMLLIWRRSDGEVIWRQLNQASKSVTAALRSYLREGNESQRLSEDLEKHHQDLLLLKSLSV